MRHSFYSVLLVLCVILLQGCVFPPSQRILSDDIFDLQVWDPDSSTVMIYHPVKNEYGEVGLADENLNIVVPAKYAHILPHSTLMAVAKTQSGNIVQVDLQSLEETPFPFPSYQHMQPRKAVSHPYFVVGSVGRTGCAFLSPDGQQYTVVKNLTKAIDDYDAPYRVSMSSQKVFFEINNPANKTSGLCIVGFDGKLVNTIMGAETFDLRNHSSYAKSLKYTFPKVTSPELMLSIGMNPRPLSSNVASENKYYAPITDDGLVVMLPENVLGLFPLDHPDSGIIGWGVAIKTPGGIRYKISLDSAIDTLKSLDQYPRYKNIERLTLYKPDLHAYSESVLGSYGILTGEDRGEMCDLFPEGNRQYVLELENGQGWYNPIGFFINEAIMKMDQDILGETPLDAVLKRQFRTHQYCLDAYREKTAKAEQVKSDHHEYILKLYNQRMNSDNAYGAYSVAKELGGDYFARWIKRFGPLSADDAALVAQSDPETAEAAAQKWQAKVDEWKKLDNENDAYERSVEQHNANLGKSDSEDDVNVMVLENGRMIQRRMSRQHYDAYYAP